MELTSLRRLLAVSLVSTAAPFITAVSNAESFDSSILSRGDPLGLFGRDDGCASVGLSSDYTSCGGGLPNNFCCNTKAGDTCVPFNDNKSVICCPKGQNCSKFYQLPCDAQGLNVSVSANANSSIHSTVIEGGLTTCDTNKCCPQGFGCAADGLCAPTNATSTASSTSAAAVLTQMPSATSNPSGSASASNTDSNSSDGQPTEDNQCQAFPITAVLVGFFPGMVLGVVLTIITIVCLGRKSRKARELTSSSTSPDVYSQKYNATAAPSGHGFSRKVSEPIMQGGGAMRTDFLGLGRLRTRSFRSTASPQTSSSHIAGNSPNRNSAMPRSLFSGSRGMKSPMEDIQENPRTPENPLRREPSTETIHVFSPPHQNNSGTPQHDNRMTRWDDVAGGAGLGLPGLGMVGRPAFQGSPRIVDGRSGRLSGGSNFRR